MSVVHQDDVGSAELADWTSWLVRSVERAPQSAFPGQRRPFDASAPLALVRPATPAVPSVPTIGRPGHRLPRVYAVLELVIFLNAAAFSVAMGSPVPAIVAAGWCLTQLLGVREDAKQWMLLSPRRTVRRFQRITPLVAVSLLFGLGDAQTAFAGFLAVAGASLMLRMVPMLAGRRHGDARVLLVGSRSQVNTAVSVGASKASGVIGYCDTGGDPRSVSTPGVAVLGDSDHIAEVAAAVRPDQVIILRAALQPEEIRELSWKLERVRTSLVIDLGAEAVAAERYSPVTHAFGQGLVIASSKPWTRRFPRDLGDRLLASLLLLLLSPVLLTIAVMVRLDSRGPAFFVQRRVGERGTQFGMVKFRSMHVDAEELARRLMEQNEGNEVLFKIHRDPRVTRVGRLLRTTSLDELPQLINVVRGEMSLIGPRPALPAEVAKYDAWARRRLAVKPGMTGLWQVSGRSNLSWSESVRLDLDYVDNWSAGKDFEIALRTFAAVVSRDGAY